MSALDDRMRDALHDLDARVADAVHQLRPVRHRPSRFVLPVLAAVAVLAVLVGSLAIGRPKDRAETVIPSEGTSSGQTLEEAARDGVYPQVAALPWKQRVEAKTLKMVTSTVGGHALSVRLVRPDLSGIKGFGADGCLAPVDAARAYPVCRNGQYTEIVAIQANTQRIVRAYPLPAKMTWMMGMNGNLYCGRDGDRTLPDSALCRLDLDTLQLTGTVFQCAEAKPTCDRKDQALSRYPGTWFASTRIAGAARIARDDASSGLSVLTTDGKIAAQVDPESLKTRVIDAPPSP